MYFLRRKGFTFLEVMIVVLIIGVIAAAVMPNFIGVTDEANSTDKNGFKYNRNSC